MELLWSALDSGVVASIVCGEAGDCEEARQHQEQYDSGIARLNRHHFNFFLIGSVLWEKERMRCPDQLFEVLDDTSGSATRLHEGECGACLAADVCNHTCCHDWFLEIGHRLRLIHEDEAARDSGTVEGDEAAHQSPSNTTQASIFRYSTAEQMDDACDPLLYGHKSAVQPGE